MNKLRTLTAPLLVLIKLHWIALCVALGVLLVYTLAGFFLVPYVARTQIEKYVTQTLHRQVSIGEIRFNPFVLDTSISDFHLREADGAPLVSFRHLYANLQLASLWQRAVVLDEVLLSTPNMEVVIEKDGSVNLAQLAPPSAEMKEEPADPTPVRIGHLSVSSGRVGVADYMPSRPFRAAIEPIRFALYDFRTDAEFANAYDFSGTTTSGEQLTWKGEFTVQPLGSIGTFGVRKLRVATIGSYLQDALPFRLTSGEADLGGTYRFAMQPGLELDVTMPTTQVRELTLAERTSEATPISLPGIEISDLAFSYQKRDLHMKQIAVNDARIDVAIEPDGSVSLMRLFGAAPTATPAGNVEQARNESPAQPASDPPASDPPATAAEHRGGASGGSSTWRVHVDTLRLSNASVLAEDRSVEPVVRFEVTPIALSVDNWSTDNDARLEVSADAVINGKGHVSGSGNVQLEPLSTRFALALEDFELPVVQPYLARTTAMTLHSGQLHAKGDVTYAVSGSAPAPVTFKGEVRIADLRTTDQLVNEDFVKWRDLALSGVDFSLNPDRLVIDRVVARQPYARVVIAADTSLNVSRVLNPQGAVDAPDSTSKGESKRAASADETAGPTFPTRIGTVQLIDGSANFADYSIEPSFATGILELNGTVVGLSSSATSRAKVKLDGKVDKYAPVDIGGEVNLLSAAMYTDLAMNFRNMELTTFNPYSGKFAGYNISKGKLSTELRYKVQERNLDAQHHIVIDNLEFGAKTDSKDAAPIPLKLAVALLKDREGVIDLELPVTGTLDDPQFRLGPIIWKALIGLLTKIVTAPFAALGALFGGGEELAYVDFAPGSAALDPSQAEKLTTLAKALVERPQLRLEIPMTIVAAQDGVALAQARFAETVPPAAELDDDRARGKRVAELEQIYEQLAGATPTYPPEVQVEGKPDPAAQIGFLEEALLERMQPDQAALTELGRQRARAVQDGLLANTELNPERVFVTTDQPDGKAQGGAVRMEMKLE